MTNTTTVGVYATHRSTGTSGLYTTGVGGGYSRDSSRTSIPGKVVGLRSATDPVPASLSDWLGSEASRGYEGRWVVLTRDAEVVAAGDSPGELPEAFTSASDNVVLFVLPRDVVISGQLKPLAASIGLAFTHGVTYPLTTNAGRPMLAVDLAGVDGTGRLLGHTLSLMLLDSGADVTMVHADFAAKLGLDITTMPAVPVGGVGGITTAFEHTVLARLCGTWAPIRVLFEPGRDTNLLGREDVFDRIRLSFLHQSGHGLILSAPHP